MVGRDLEHDDMGQDPAGADQVVGLVQDRKQEVSGLGIATHEHVRVAGFDHVDGVLHLVRIVVERVNVVLAVSRANLLQNFVDFLVAADQDGFDETVFLSHKDTLQDIL